MRVDRRLSLITRSLFVLEMSNEHLHIISMFLRNTGFDLPELPYDFIRHLRTPP